MMQLEIEAKFLVPDFVPVRARLGELGYACTKPRTLMRRYTYTLCEKMGANKDEWARVRDEGDKVTVAYKHHFDTSRIDGVEEVEFVASDFEAAARFLDRLGFKDRLQQENYREAWHKDEVQVTLDEWPVIDRVVEVEGPSEAAVAAACEELGFAYADSVFGGVGALYGRKFGKDMGLVKELTFAKAADVSKFLNS